MKSLADFKRKAIVGSRFLRRLRDCPDRIVTVAYVQSNAVVFIPRDGKMERVQENPHRYGSWWRFPKASECRFENGELIWIHPEDGLEYIAFKPIDAKNGENDGQ